MAAGAQPAVLLSMLDERGQRSRSHGLPLEVLRAQAESLGVELWTRCASWEEYEGVFVKALGELKAAGVDACVFGDIDLQEHREWEQMVCDRAGMDAHLPLWLAPRRPLIDEFFSLGFKATVVAALDEKLGQGCLGRQLDEELVSEFEQVGIDPCGEEGEYHTVVTNGPIFAKPVRLVLGETVRKLGHWVLDVSLG